MEANERPWPVMTRREAAVKGLTKYFTGKKCKHLHLSQRYVSTGTCVSCGSDNNKIYRRQLINADMGAHGPQMIEFKCWVHVDDKDGLDVHINALKAARRLMPVVPRCPHGKPTSEFCHPCDIEGAA